MDRFKVVFTGRVHEGARPDQVREAFAGFASADEALLDRIFTGVPVVLKKDLPVGLADSLADRLGNLGMVVRVEAMASSAEPLALVVEEEDEPVSRAPAANSSMDCPKCGHPQPAAAECRACGVIVAKVLEMQAQAQEGRTEGWNPVHRPMSGRAAEGETWLQSLRASWLAIAPVVIVLLVAWKWWDRLTPGVFSETELRDSYAEFCDSAECEAVLDQRWEACFAGADYASYEAAIASHRQRELDALLERLDTCLVDETGNPLMYGVAAY